MCDSTPRAYPRPWPRGLHQGLVAPGRSNICFRLAATLSPVAGEVPVVGKGQGSEEISDRLSSMYNGMAGKRLLLVHRHIAGLLAKLSLVHSEDQFLVSCQGHSARNS